MRARHGEAAALGVALGARRGADGVGRLLLQQGFVAVQHIQRREAALQLRRELGQGDLHARQCIAAPIQTQKLDIPPFLIGDLLCKLH